MQKVIISADSAADFNPGQAEQYGIRIIPLHILHEGREYLDGRDIFARDLFKAFDERRVLPSTSAVTPAEYTEFFRSFTDAG